MSVNKPMPQVEIGVALLRDADKILVVYNREWRAFTLPMSKRRSWLTGGDLMTEAWEDAAARAAAEVTGRTCHPVMVHEMEQVQQSDSSGGWKYYHFRVYGIRVAPGACLLPGTVAEWLTADEILDAARRPMSMTVTSVIGDMRSNRKL